MKSSKRRWDIRTQEVFTTGQAAAATKVSIHTIIDCVESGDLKAFRVPGSRHRRITRKELIAFMTRHELPLGELENKIQILVLDEDGWTDDFLELLKSDDRFSDPVLTQPGFNLGMDVAAIKPNVLLCAMPGECKGVVELLQRVELLCEVKGLLLGVPEEVAEKLNGDKRFLSLAEFPAAPELYRRLLSFLPVSPREVS